MAAPAPAPGSGNAASAAIPTSLSQPGAVRFWLVVIAIGIATGIGAVLLTLLLHWVQRLAWGGSGDNILDVATRAGPWHHVLVLTGAGVLVGIGQLVLVRLTSGNGIDISSAIWFSAGRLPALRTLGSAVLSIVIVGLGASLGREGAPKQAGAVFANLLVDKAKLSDEQRRLLVACGAGAGMAAAYGVPLGGALFSLEALRGTLALRLVRRRCSRPSSRRRCRGSCCRTRAPIRSTLSRLPPARSSGLWSSGWRRPASR